MLNYSSNGTRLPRQNPSNKNGIETIRDVNTLTPIKFRSLNIFNVRLWSI